MSLGHDSLFFTLYPGHLVFLSSVNSNAELEGICGTFHVPRQVVDRRE